MVADTEQRLDPIAKIEQETMKDNPPQMQVGDSVRVHTRIYEGDKQRIQVFKGVVIALDGGGSTETFTVRRISHGVGVERVFPIHSPHVEKVEVERSGHVRRSKLYYLRNRTGRKARLRSRVNR